jgi:hypothetical protein
MFRALFLILVVLNSVAYGQQINYYKGLKKGIIDTAKLNLFNTTDSQLVKIINRNEQVNKFDKIDNRYFYLIVLKQMQGKTYAELQKVNTAAQYYQIINDSKMYYFGYTKVLGMVTIYGTKLPCKTTDACYKQLLEVLAFYNLPYEVQTSINQKKTIITGKGAISKKVYLLK